MSSYEFISLIVWTISSLAVILSLYWVNRQTSLFARQTEYVAHSLVENLSENMSSQSREITRIFIEYPEMRPYFYYAQAVEEDHPDYHRAEAVAELILDIFWTMSTTAERAVTTASMPTTPGNLWQEYVEDAFAQSPILVKTLMKRQNWYGQEMVKRMKLGLERHSLSVAA